MEFLNEFLPIIIYILLIVLIVILIVLALKCNKTMDKVDLIVDDVDKKVKTFDDLFEAIDNVNSKINMVSDRAINIALGIGDKLFGRKKKRKEIEEEYDYE